MLKDNSKEKTKRKIKIKIIKRQFQIKINFESLLKIGSPCGKNFDSRSFEKKIFIYFLKKKKYEVVSMSKASNFFD